MSDFIAVLKNGEIVEYQDAKSIFSKPQNEYVKNLIALGF